MKPEAARFLDRAQNLLTRAAMLSVGLNEDAGRTAYLAGFHAARALLFEHRNHDYTNHGRVQKEFLKLTKDDARLDPQLRAFLSNAYNLKTIADYEIGPGSQVSAGRAKEAIQTAHRFVSSIASLIPANEHTPRAPEPQPKP